MKYCNEHFNKEISSMRLNNFQANVLKNYTKLWGKSATNCRIISRLPTELATRLIM